MIMIEFFFHKTRFFKGCCLPWFFLFWVDLYLMDSWIEQSWRVCPTQTLLKLTQVFTKYALQTWNENHWKLFQHKWYKDMTGSNWRSGSHCPATPYSGSGKNPWLRRPREVTADARRGFSISRSCYSGTFSDTTTAFQAPPLCYRTGLSSLGVLNCSDFSDVLAQHSPECQDF